MGFLIQNISKKKYPLIGGGGGSRRYYNWSYLVCHQTNIRSKRVQFLKFYSSYKINIIYLTFSDRLLFQIKLISLETSWKIVFVLNVFEKKNCSRILLTFIFLSDTSMILLNTCLPQRNLCSQIQHLPWKLWF